MFHREYPEPPVPAVPDTPAAAVETDRATAIADVRAMVAAEIPRHPKGGGTQDRLLDMLIRLEGL